MTGQSPKFNIAQMIQEVVNTNLKVLQEQVANLSNKVRALREPIAPPQQPPQHPVNTTTEGITTPTNTPPEAPREPELPQAHIRMKLLPNPLKFSGKRREYPAWSQQMRDKLVFDAHFFNSNNELWYLVNDCLDVSPKLLVTTFYTTAGPENNWNPMAFMEYLDRQYKDHDAAKKAASSLRTLRQRDGESFVSFLPKFERLVAEAGGSSWDDQVKISFLEGAINSQLVRTLVTVALPVDYIGWLRIVQEIAWKIERLKKQPIKDRHQRRNRNPPVNQKDPNGDVKIGGVNRTTDRRKKGSAASRRRGSSKDRSDDNNKEVREETRRCFQCNKTDHLRANCPRKKKKRVAKVVIIPVESSDEAATSQSEDIEDSGNE